jgi:phosphocarrier protein HPr
MITQTYIITAAQGMHARPATALVKLARNYESSINIQKGDKVVKLNSLINILSMTIKGGDAISIIIEGEDEVMALQAIDHFFKEQLKEL